MRTALLLIMLLGSMCLADGPVLEISVTDFGARLDSTTDDTVAFQKALDALPNRGVLNIPAGTAILSSPLVLSNKIAVIRGAGSGVTRLSWNAPGGLHLVETRTWRESRAQKASWDVRDIAFTTRVADGGTALFADFKSSDRLDMSIAVQGCRFEGAGSRAGWTTSIRGHNAHIGQVAHCTFRGQTDTEVHVHLTGNSTCFVIEACHGMNSVYGILVEGQTEGVIIRDCYFVHNRYGFVLNITTGGEPMFNVMNSHASSGVYPIWIKNGRSSSLVGNCLILSRCSQYQDGAGSREGIRIEGKRAKDIIVSASTIQITDKAFTDTFTGIHAITGNGLILANNTVANNSASSDDHGILIEKEVRQPVCSGNVFHLRSDRRITNRSAAPQAIPAIGE